MTQQGFFERRPINAPGLAVVIAMHAAVLTAVALSKMEVPPMVRYFPTVGKNIPLPKDPPPNRPEPEKQQKPLPRQPQTPTKPDSEVDIRLPGQVDFGRVPTLPDPRTAEGSIVESKPADPPRDPVRIAAAIDPRAVLQPDYPASEQRRGGEGSVSVRVLIGLDGRVKAVEKVSATSDAFYRATERQALLRWRFTPATVDGKPVESWKVLTVRFELKADA